MIRATGSAFCIRLGLGHGHMSLFWQGCGVSLSLTCGMEATYWRGLGLYTDRADSCGEQIREHAVVGQLRRPRWQVACCVRLLSVPATVTCL